MTIANIHFHAANTDAAQDELERLTKTYKQCAPEDADVIVTLGGDGTLLESFHKYHSLNTPFYGLNLGTVGS